MHPRTPKCVLFLTYTKLQSIYLFKATLTCQNLEKKQKKIISAASPRDKEMFKKNDNIHYVNTQSLL